MRARFFSRGLVFTKKYPNTAGPTCTYLHALIPSLPREDARQDASVNTERGGQQSLGCASSKVLCGDDELQRSRLLLLLLAPRVTHTPRAGRSVQPLPHYNSRRLGNRRSSRGEETIIISPPRAGRSILHKVREAKGGTPRRVRLGAVCSVYFLHRGAGIFLPRESSAALSLSVFFFLF